MGYWLGIDVGSTHTAAALCREQAGRRGLPEVVSLGSRSAVVTSVVYQGPEGQVVVGEAAERHATTHPERVVREYVRHIGEQGPMTIGATQHPASTIAAWTVRWVVDRVAQREGGPAQGITITYPAGWGAHHIQAMTDALRAADLPEVTFCPESLAAAASYSIREPVGGNSTIAVYDLGGSTFDAAVVRRNGDGTFSVLGTPERIERLGGASFDDAVFGHVLAAIPALGELDLDAPVPPAVAARLRRSFTACRRECAEAKEALSASAEVTIPVLFPEIQTQVTLVRDEFEELIHRLVAQTVEALRRALRSAGVDPVDLDAVLLVGGSSRVPLVAQVVSADLGCPVVAGSDPETAIALGAALSGLPASTAQPGAIAAAPTGHAAGFGGPVRPAVEAKGPSEPAASAPSVPMRAGEP
ncbi:MAG: Hsp70 family protein, partial [Pseudonocardiaceae bacterium]